MECENHNLFLALASRGRHPANVDLYSVPEEECEEGKREMAQSLSCNEAK